jgi:Kyakuja-Dileera-Zisupton transposase
LIPCVIIFIVGERWAYATFILYLVITAGVLPLFLFYDINCRYKAHALAFAQKASALGWLSPAQAMWVCDVMSFPLPPWHHYMHNVHCQRRNSLRNMLWGGTGQGEPMEIFWSNLRPLGVLSQYASLASRELTLERAMMIWNGTKLRKLPQLLGRMFVRAQLKKEEAESRMESVQAAIGEAVAAGRERSQAEHDALVAARDDIMRTPPALQLESIADDLPWEAEYVQLSKIAAAIDSTATATGDEIDQILDGPAGRNLKPTSKFAQTSKRRFEALRTEHTIVEDWAEDSQEYIKGWALFLMHRKQFWQVAASQCLITISLLKHLINKLLSRRGDVSKLTKLRSKEYARLDEAAKKLVDVCRKIVGVMEKVESPGDVLDKVKREAKAVLDLVKENGGAAALVDLKNKILQCEFPWLNVAGFGESSIERYRLPLHMAIWEYRRADEEMQLVDAEVKGLIGQLDKRIDAIAEAIEKHERTLLIQEALAQELPTSSAEHLNQDQVNGALPMEVENMEGLPRSGQEHAIINDARQAGVGVSLGVDATQDPDTMMLDDPDSIGGLNGVGVAVASLPANMSNDDNSDEYINIKEKWLEMCLKQVDACEATQAESSIAFLGTLMDEMRRLRGATVGIRTQICSITIVNEEEIAQQQAEALIEELMDRDQAQDESNDEEDF